MEELKNHISDLDDKIATLERRVTHLSGPAKERIERVLADLQDARNKLMEETSDDVAVANEFWAQHIERIEQAWNRVVMEAVENQENPHGPTDV